MSMPPPIGENPYPRGHVPNYGSAAKLRMLRDAYYGIYWMVAGSAGLGILGQIAFEFVPAETFDSVIAIVIGLNVLVIVVNFFIALKYANLVREAKDQGSGYAVMLAVGSALLSPCCFGLVGCIVIQQAVANEGKKYGIENKFLGMKKADFDRQIEMLERSGRP